MNSYDSVLEAINELKLRGFTADFILQEDSIVFQDKKINPSEFEITEVYRFEGESDPDDESVVFAIESNDGLKGILVNAFSIYSETISDEMIKKLTIHRY
jgi:hypothetical protein